MRDQAGNRKFVLPILAMAIFVAPFLGLLFDVKVALGVMAATLSATAVILREASRSADDVARRLQAMVGINITLAIGCVVALAWLLANGR